MSRVGKQELQIPDKTTVTVSSGLVTVTGPLGTLSKSVKDNVLVTVSDSKVTFTPRDESIESRALWGTYASHVKNMILGVNTPFQKKLILEGVGFKAEVKGGDLVMSLGFSHQVIVKIPAGLTVTAEKGILTISGIDKELVGEFSASTRALKKPEPYKGKGFRYNTEVIRRKQGKKTA